MSRPLAVRLTDLRRSQAWPLIAFAVLSGRLAADFDLLAAQHAGRSFAPALEAIYPGDLAALRAAAARLDWTGPWTAAVLRRGLPLAVAATGHAPSALTPDDLEMVRQHVRASPYYPPGMRRALTSQLHGTGRLLFEARITDDPPAHCRGEGPGNLASRLACAGAPEIRRVMLAWLLARQAVVRVSSIRNLASHLAAFGSTSPDPWVCSRRSSDVRPVAASRGEGPVLARLVLRWCAGRRGGSLVS